MRSLPVLLLGLSLLAAPVAAQCAAPIGVPDGDPKSGSANSIPFGSSATYTAGYTMVGVIPASFMDPLNPYVEDVAFAAANGSGNWSCGTVIIALGHIPTPAPAPFNFPTFDAAGIIQSSGSFSPPSQNPQNPTILHNSIPGGTLGQLSTTGPFSWNVIKDTWSPMGFSGTGGTGFTWDGTNDVAFFITFSSAVVTGWTGTFHRDTLPRYYASGYSATSASSSNSGLKIQLLVTAGPGLGAIPVWQCNRASSSVDVSGAPDPGPIAPMVTVVGAGATVPVNFGGLVGQPFDLVVTSPEQGLPVGGGGFLTLSGTQAVNIDVSAPSLGFFFNGAFTNAFTPYTVFVSVPLPLSFAFQQVVLDPAHADGLGLSHLNELSWVNCSASENWDSLPTGTGVAPIGWVNPAAGAVAWTVKTGGTATGSTGPTSAFNGPNYAYCETSTPNFPNVTFVFDTCAADTATLSSGILSFELSAIGVDIGTLNVYQGNATGLFGPTPIHTQTGAVPGQAQGGVQWTNQSIPLTLNSPYVNFRFEYISGASYRGDLAIDDIQLN